jgi:hypothetical protein
MRTLYSEDLQLSRKWRPLTTVESTEYYQTVGSSERRSGRTVSLGPGEKYIIPKGVEHRRMAKE